MGDNIRSVGGQGVMVGVWGAILGLWGGQEVMVGVWGAILGLWGGTRGNGRSVGGNIR